MSNPKFDGLLADMKAMHDRKSNDYASDANRYSNFERAGAVAVGFTDPVDIAFAVLIGVKIARLAELKGKGKTPNNESVADTQLDLAVYAALWASYGYPTKAAPLPVTSTTMTITAEDFQAAHSSLQQARPLFGESYALASQEK